ncbi:MAG: VCBS repeat-containing protein, partial [Planctomycetota bacterium]
MRSSRITRHFVALVASGLAASEASAQDARFDLRPALAATGSLDAVTVADIDGDGDSDVVATDTATGRIVWIENDSDVDPAFPIEHVIASGVIAPGEVAAADLDGDGDVDVAAAGSAATADLLWFENLGGVPPEFMARTLGPRPNLNASGIVRSVTVADLQGDGGLDLVCGFELPSAAASGHVTVYLNNGALPTGFTRFQLPSPAALLSEVTGVAVADISGDGALDVVACSRDTTAGSNANSVVSWRNTGVGGTGFLPSIIASALGEPAAVAVAQLSADALPDIAVATQGGGRVYVFENNQAAPGTFLSPLPLLAVDTVDVAAADLTGSPRPDLVAITSQGPLLFENQGGPVLSFAATAIEAGVGSFDSVAIGPIDDDADNDIVVAGPGGARWIERVTPVENTTSGSVHSSLADAVSNVNSGDVLRATPEHFVPNLTLPPALASYELESTGSLVIGPRADAAFGSDARLRPAQGFVARLSGPVDLAPGTVLEIESQAPVEVTAGQDLDSAKLVVPASALQLKLSPDWTPEEIDGAFSAAPTPLSMEPRDAQFFDPSIDGPPVIVVVSEVIGGGASQQPGTLSVYTQSGVSPTGWVAMPVDDGETGVHRSVAVGDVNNDGADDIVSVFDPATGGQAVLRLHVSDGESPPSFTSMSVAPAVADGAQVVFDLDRDGLADIVTPTGYYRQAAPQTFSFVSFPLVGGDQGIGVSIARLDPDFEPDVVVHTAVLADLPPRRVGFRLTALQSDGVGGFTPVIIDSL